jgi:hypothetical protein
MGFISVSLLSTGTGHLKYATSLANLVPTYLLEHK